jgi:hypothetical protein
MAAAGGYCQSGNCPDYDAEPRAGHFWPEEESLKLAAARAREGLS